MTWLPLLLADPSPCLRLLVLRELMGKPDDDAEVAELVQSRHTDRLLDAFRVGGGWPPQPEETLVRGGDIQAAGLALARLGYLGFGPDHPHVQSGADYLYERQGSDGSWPLAAAKKGGEEEGYSMIPLQTAFPLRGLAACGYASDARSERAYEWLLGQRLPDGAWPTGLASGNYGYVAGYRRLPHSRWGCRSNTTAALICLSLHPERRHGPDARRALDLLLGRETREAHVLGCEVARLVGAEPARGFITFFARYDLAVVLGLCARAGASRDDPRVADLIRFVSGLRGPYGLWEYAPRPQVSRWVTFDLLRSLKALDEGGDWLSLEPRTSFQPYPGTRRRY